MWEESSPSSDEALLRLGLSPVRLARPPVEAEPSPAARICEGCERSVPSRFWATGVVGLCVVCSAMEDLRFACFELGRVSAVARRVAEVGWRVRRIWCSSLFDQACEAGPAQFFVNLQAAAGDRLTAQPPLHPVSEPGCLPPQR